jgi:competence protein ComEA
VKPVAQAKAPADKPAASKPVLEAASPKSSPEAVPALVSLQNASIDQLAQVPGINKKLASEIVKARPFKSLDELNRVRGLGESSIRKLRALLSL